MSERNYKKKFEFQKKIIEKQAQYIDSLKCQIEQLTLDCKKKDELINSVSPLKDELAQDISEVKKYKEEYEKLVNELRKMKTIMNQTVYKGRWRLIRYLIK